MKAPLLLSVEATIYQRLAWNENNSEDARKELIEEFGDEMGEIFDAILSQWKENDDWRHPEWGGE